MITLGDYIMRAINHIEKHGWIKEQTFGMGGSACALGSLGMAALPGMSPEYYEQAKELLAKHVPAEYRHPYRAESTIIAYNDKYCKDIEELREWFTKAALDAGVTEEIGL